MTKRSSQSDLEDANTAYHVLNHGSVSVLQKGSDNAPSILVICPARLLDLQSQAIILDISAPWKDCALVICRVEWQAQDHFVLAFFQEIRVEFIFVRQCVAYHCGSGSA